MTSQRGAIIYRGATLFCRWMACKVRSITCPFDVLCSLNLHMAAHVDGQRWAAAPVGSSVASRAATCPSSWPSVASRRAEVVWGGDTAEVFADFLTSLGAVMED